jgi:hypothetical protein
MAKTDATFKEKYTNIPPGEIELTSNYYYQAMQIEQDLLSKYKEFTAMDDELIEVTSALDIYADNAVSGGTNLEKEFTVVLAKPDKKIQTIIDDIDKTELKDVIWNIARSTLKYGNWFVEVVPKDDKLLRFKELPVEEMRLRKDEYGRLKDIVQKQATGKEIPIDIWKCVHFSMNRPYSYGTSILNRLRRISRQLRLCEDALVIARLTKATQKIIYKIDVTGMNSIEALAYIKKWKASMRKKRILNPITGEIVNDYNPLRDEEDIFLPVRSQSATDVTPLPGDANISDIADISFLQNRLFAGLKIPKAYMGFEGDTHNRNVITALDIQFARQVRRLQKVLEKGLRHIYDIAFILAGYNPEEIEYKITFPVISTIDALTEWQVNQTKLMTAQLILGMGISLPDEWILSNLLGLPKSEVETIVNYTKETEKLQKEEEAAQGVLQGITGEQTTAQTTPASEQSNTLTPEDLERLQQSEGNASFKLLAEILRSNKKLQNLMEDTHFLINWKMDYLAAQDNLTKMQKVFNK